MQNISRRHLCRLALDAGGTFGLGLAVWRQARNTAAQETPDAATLPDGLQVVSHQSWALGSDVSLTVIHPDRAAAERAIRAAMAELRHVERLMSLYRPDSQLCQLNRQGVLQRPHIDLVAVLRIAEHVARQTQGAFDVTVQPLWELYAQAKRAGRLPESAAVEATRQRVDWRRVSVQPERIELLGEGMAVTLNGIAQGFAADRVMAVLRQHGVRHALVNTGEIASLDGKTEKEDWTVGIQHPRRKDAYARLAKLRARALSTSGDYATAFSDDYRYNHLFDPRTGRSPESFSSVSVAAPTACQADALSTAVFVLGPERGLQLVRSTPGADALLIFKDGRTLATSGFPEEVQS